MANGAVRGFTLIELLLVIVIIAILRAIFSLTRSMVRHIAGVVAKSWRKRRAAADRAYKSESAERNPAGIQQRFLSPLVEVVVNVRTDLPGFESISDVQVGDMDRAEPNEHSKTSLVQQNINFDQASIRQVNISGGAQYIVNREGLAEIQAVMSRIESVFRAEDSVNPGSRCQALRRLELLNQEIAKPSPKAAVILECLGHIAKIASVATLANQITTMIVNKIPLH